MRQRNHRPGAQSLRPGGSRTGQTHFGSTTGSHDLDIQPGPRFQGQGLGDGLLGAEARGQVKPGPCMSSGVGQLLIGEEPGCQPRPALERTLEPVDLQNVDANHAAERNALEAKS